VKARILALDSDEHRQAELLLPWYTNGTLDAAQRARVEAHLLQCPRCQADVAFQAKLRDVAGSVAAPTGDAARGWAALRERLDPKPPVVRRAGPRRRWRWTGWWPLAFGVQAAVILGLAIAWVGVTLRPEPYQTLGAATSAPAANALVVFRPEATEAQIRAALRASDARLVGGPTVTDAYLVQLAGPVPQALGRLRAQPAVSRVESLVSGSPR
jgi:anti-sigma factor RsiW